MSENDFLNERVARGVALLDEKAPGWYEKINLDNLYMGSTFACVIGQISEGAYNDGLAALGLDEDTSPRYGFDFYNISEGSSTRWNDLQNLWTAEILKRRENDRAKELV